MTLLGSSGSLNGLRGAHKHFPCVNLSATSTVSSGSSSSLPTTSRGKGGEMDPFHLDESLTSSSSSSSNIDDNIALSREKLAATSSNQDQNNDQRDVDDAKPAAVNDLHRDVPTQTRIERELDHLSEEERQIIVRDVQGVVPSSNNNSPTGFLSSRLRLSPNDNLIPSFQYTLQHEIQNLQMQPGNEDLISVLSSSGLANDTDLQKKMLLAEYNNVPCAVNRLIGYLRLLQDVLGPKTFRAVSLADMSEQDRQLQRKGTIQLFKFRDAHGRRVVGCFESGSGSCLNSLSQVRLTLFIVCFLRQPTYARVEVLILCSRNLSHIYLTWY